jgi:hypothetical protein
MLSDGESSQLCAYLKERNIPYFLHSGYNSPDAVTDGAASIPKPASPQLLVTAVEGYCATSKLRNALT